jgi:LysM repeat protein
MEATPQMTDQNGSDNSDVDQEDLYLEEYHHPFKTPRSPLAQHRLLFIIAGVVLLVVVVYLGWHVSNSDGRGTRTRLDKLEKQVVRLEKRLAALDRIEGQLTRLENSTQQVDVAVTRIDRIETAMSLRMDLLARELAALQNTSESHASPEETKSTSQAPELSKAPPSIHTVAAGETLYQISRKYGLAVEALRRINNLDKTATIYPGQKLNLRPMPSNP